MGRREVSRSEHYEDGCLNDAYDSKEGYQTPLACKATGCLFGRFLLLYLAAIGKRLVCVLHGGIGRHGCPSS